MLQRAWVVCFYGIMIGIFAMALTCKAKKESPYRVGRITTAYGVVWIWLYDSTPYHKDSFIELATGGYWDSLTFNRVVPGFVIQGGCPDTPEGFTDPLYLLSPEGHATLTHAYGAVGAGRDDNPEKCSARCQFYIVQDKRGVHRLDGQYTIFGKVIKGMDVVEAIARVPRDSLDAPLDPITLDVDVVSMSEQALQKICLACPPETLPRQTEKGSW